MWNYRLKMAILWSSLFYHGCWEILNSFDSREIIGSYFSLA